MREKKRKPAMNLVGAQPGRFQAATPQMTSSSSLLRLAVPPAGMTLAQARQEAEWAEAVKPAAVMDCAVDFTIAPFNPLSVTDDRDAGRGAR